MTGHPLHGYIRSVFYPFQVIHFVSVTQVIVLWMQKANTVCRIDEILHMHVFVVS